MSKWRSVTSGVVQRSVLGPALFYVFVSDMNSEIECGLRKFDDEARRKMLRDLGFCSLEEAKWYQPTAT